MPIRNISRAAGTIVPLRGAIELHLNFRPELYVLSEISMEPVFLRALSRLLPLATLAALSLTSSGQELGHYIGGFTGLENGTSPPPGFYAAAFGLAEPIQSIKGPNGHTVLRPDINVGG